MKDDYQDRFLFSCWRTCFGSLLLLGAVLPGWSQTNLAERVLVVYNASVPESIAVANYYLTQRGIPAENKCAITPTDPTAIEWNEFDSTVKTPLRACVDALGKERILYIVFAYQTPFRLLNVPTESGLEMRALDQFAADLWNDQVADVTTITSHPYFATAQSQGNVYAPFVSLSDFRKQLNATQLYSVWRLDAATAELARGLVDKAMQTEANGLRGQGVFDRRFGPAAGLEDWNYGAGDWDLQRAADATRRAGLPVTEDEQEPEFGTAPAPLFCDQVALYAGWYSYNNYNDAFEWAPGAIGLHLDSASAADPRGGANWAANALQHGITVTSGAVNEPYLEGLAHPDGVFRDLFAGARMRAMLCCATPLFFAMDGHRQHRRSVVPPISWRPVTVQCRYRRTELAGVGQSIFGRRKNDSRYRHIVRSLPQMAAEILE
ncbi:MAG: TIGR03790 family protein [Blastocatellia bacterium]